MQETGIFNRISPYLPSGDRHNETHFLRSFGRVPVHVLFVVKILMTFHVKNTGSFRMTNLARLLFVGTLLFAVGCSTYEPFAPTRELSWRWNAPQSHNPIFVERHDHEFLWSIVVDVIDNHFEIERDIPIRLYGNVLTEGHLETKPKIGASLSEWWHADSVGFNERLDSTLQTVRRRVEVHVVPEISGYTIEVKVFKELEDNSHPLRAVANASNLRFQDNADEFADKIDVDPSSAGWFIIERDAALENRLLDEIVYRLKNPPEVIRPAREPVRGESINVCEQKS